MGAITAMSAKCEKRTFQTFSAMSAKCQRRYNAVLFDYLYETHQAGCLSKADGYIAKFNSHSVGGPRTKPIGHLSGTNLDLVDAFQLHFISEALTGSWCTDRCCGRLHDKIVVVLPVVVSRLMTLPRLS